MNDDARQLKFFLIDLLKFLSRESNKKITKKIKIDTIFLNKVLNTHLPRNTWKIKGGKDNKNKTCFWIDNGKICISISNKEATIEESGLNPCMPNQEVNLETFLYMKEALDLFSLWKLTEEYKYWISFSLNANTLNEEDQNYLKIK